MGEVGDEQMFLRATGRSFVGLSAELERSWRGPFYFAMGADPQLGLWDAWSRGACGTSGTMWERELALTHEAVRALNLLRPRPRFLTLCGDLVHDMPGQPKRNEQMKDLRNALRNLDPAIPLVLVPGNHDLGNEPTTESIASFRHAWGDDYFAFWVGGVRFLVLNSQLFVSTKACQREGEEHNNWLGKELAECTEAKKVGKDPQHVIVLQHIPLFLSTANEEDGYFNIPLDLRHQLIEKFQQAGVTAVLAGHYHRNAGGSVGPIEMIVSSAMGCPLGQDPPGLRLVTVTKESIHHSYYAMDKIPTQIDLGPC
uniref:serine/threonine-protein phosphatase CPPED1 n=1 Tax=Myxine glutinosa TaxID=7769 RepID=UPI00358EC1BD